MSDEFSVHLKSNIDFYKQLLLSYSIKIYLPESKLCSQTDDRFSLFISSLLVVRTSKTVKLVVKMEVLTFTTLVNTI